MADRKDRTLQELRALARKVLGSGYSRLKKHELAEALEAAAGKPSPARKAARAPARRAAPAPARPPAPEARAKPGAGKKAAPAKAVVSAAAAGPAAEPAGKPGARRAARPGASQEPAPAPAERARKVARKARTLGRGMAALPGARRAGTQLDPESYFVARVRGEEAVRDAPHPMTEAAVEAAGGRGAAEPAPVWDEQLGDLPWAYQDDTLVALPRDPRTLFVYWDHAAETLRQGWQGLDGGRPEIWVFAQLPDGGWERVRVVDFALQSRSWYVHDLEPGRVYRAEIHLVDRHQDRLLHQPSNPVQLPAVGPSPVVDDRFARITWGEQLLRWLAEARPGGPFSEELRAQLAGLSDWARFEDAGEGGGAGGTGGRPSSPTARSGAGGRPSSPWGGGRQP